MNKQKVKKAKRLEKLTKEYKRGLLQDRDIIDIIKEVFKDEK